MLQYADIFKSKESDVQSWVDGRAQSNTHCIHTQPIRRTKQEMAEPWQAHSIISIALDHPLEFVPCPGEIFTQ